MAQINIFPESIANTVVLTSTANGPGKNNGILLTRLANGIYRIQRSNNNKNSKSQPYQQIDQTIINIDNEYKFLFNQADWEAYAATIAGQWAACANCEIADTAQKLFRVVTLNRNMLGLPFSTFVPTEQFVFTGVLSDIIYEGGSTTPPYFIASGGDISPSPFWLTAIANQGLFNPMIQTSATELANPIYLDTPLGVYVQGLYNIAGLDINDFEQQAQIQLCVSGLDGQPGQGLQSATLVTNVSG